MPRSFTVVEYSTYEPHEAERTYHGFDREIKTADYLAIVQEEDTIVVFALDHGFDVSGLTAYLCEETPNSKILAITRRID